jgi:hypothetical protein
MVVAGPRSPSAAASPEITEGVPTLLSRIPVGKDSDQVGREAECEVEANGDGKELLNTQGYRYPGTWGYLTRQSAHRRQLYPNRSRRPFWHVSGSSDSFL